MVKKIISFVLVALMVMCMVPGVAMAAGTSCSNACNIASHVAAIGNTHYDSIKDAVDEAQVGDTVVVIKDHEIDCSGATVLKDTIHSLINVENNITIDLNGKTITAKTGDKDIILINVQEGGDLTLIDTIGGGSISVTAEVDTYALLCCWDASSKLTVNGGSYRLNRGGNGRGLVYCGKYTGNPTVTINDGTFILDNVGKQDNRSPWIFNVSGQDKGHITVNNGTFNDDIANQYYRFEVYIKPGKVLVKNGEMWTLEESAAYVTEDLHNTPCCSQYTVGYQTLKEAIEAAKKNNIKTGNNDFISLTLNKDCPVSETIVIDFELIDDQSTVDYPEIGKGMVMNGKTIIWKGNDTDPIFTVKEGGLLTVNGAFTPQKANHIFQGWYTDKDYKTPYDSFGVGAESTINNTNGSEDISLYAKWSDDAPISSGYSGPDVWYIGGNTFGTTTNQVPTSVEIDNVPVSFTMNGNQITVGCIQPGSDWVTVRWGSVSNQRSFTPDANAYCTQTVIPKTGDVSFWAAISEFLGF